MTGLESLEPRDAATLIRRSGVFDTELMAKRPEAGAVWAKSRLRDRIDAVIAHEEAESLTGDHDLAEAMAPETALPITNEARQILRAIRGKPREL
jgi:hypothetical protein